MRAILHSDLNNFYASVECLGHPELASLPVVVGGAQEERHGIVLAKNMVAKQAGITTGMTLWQAKQICPNLVYFRPNFAKYLDYSRRVKQIYRRFTDQLESFGIDECWLDVSHSTSLFGSPKEIAEKIRQTVFEETGLTVSIGVSFCKVFAKLGSDIKKPNAVTEIPYEKFREIVWPLEIDAMIGIGRKTKRKLEQIGIKTLGELANTDKRLLRELFGKNGEWLHDAANGLDNSPVFEDPSVKSVGNSMTYYRDITNKKDSKALLLLLSESVAARVADENLGLATTVHLFVRESDLFSYSRQMHIEPSALAIDFLHAAEKLLEPTHDKRKAIRALGVSVSGFVKTKQFSLIDNNYNKKLNAEVAVEKIRNRFGRLSMHRALTLCDQKLATLNIKNGHDIDASKF